MNAQGWIQRAARSMLDKACASLVSAGLVTCSLTASVDAQQMIPYNAAQMAPVAPANYGYGYGYGAYGYAPAYGYGPGMWVQPAAYAPHHGGGNYPCPCPTQTPAPVVSGEGSDTGEGAPEGTDNVPIPADEDLPEVADLSSDAAYASADQSAVPNMIGDTIGYGGTGILYVTNFINQDDSLSVSPGGGRKYKVATNNSPVPQSRFYYNFHYFDNALTATNFDGVEDRIWSIDVKRHELGFEWATCDELTSLQVTVPFSWSIDSTLIQDTGVIPTPHDTELGNVSFALKRVMYQNCYTTLSAGLGVDLPTAEDVFVDNGLSTFELRNNTVTASPYIGFLTEPTCHTFFQSFIQYAMPFGENGVSIGDDYSDDIAEMKLIHIDTSFGAWLYNDGCGTAVAALGELHFTTTVGDEQLVAVEDGGIGTAFFEDNWKALHATAGMTLMRCCWDVTPAVVFPLFDDPDRFFDWEATIQVNRRF